MHRCSLKSFLIALLVPLALVAAGCTTTPTPREPLPPSYAFGSPEVTPLAREVAARRPANAAPGTSALFLLGQGVEAFSARNGLAQRATRTLDVQYYAIFADESGSLLLGELADAARRGVRVRLLVDDLNTPGTRNDLALLASIPGIEVRLFNPFAGRTFGPARLLEFIVDGERLNRRMHNKAWIADNVGAITGGRNLGNTYFSGPSETVFADLDVLTFGPVTREVSRSFDRYWNSEWAVPITPVEATPDNDKRTAALAEFADRIKRVKASQYGESLRKSDPVGDLFAGRRAMVWATAHAVVDPVSKFDVDKSPEVESYVMTEVVEQLRAAKTSLLLVSPYFVPGESGVALLKSLVDRGVKVRALTNSLGATDVPLVHAGYSKYRPALIKNGVELFELKATAAPDIGPQTATRSLPPGSEASLHAKAFVIDQRTVLIGSMNFDPRSAWYNSELGILVDSPVLAAQVTQAFDRLTTGDRVWRMAYDVDGVAWLSTDPQNPAVIRDEPARFWRRMTVQFLGPLAPEGYM
ncbi:MAG: phospholipase D family protein [Burkholderiaceae bacterium]|nr:phospholipase D family protein [Burkholderiaceae bacterium]